MGANAFAEFVASQQPTPEDAAIDWAEERDDFLRNLQGLYDRIGDFLKEYVDNGSIRYSFSDMRLSEENLGTYPARRMDIRIGRKSIYLEPIGTLLIGNKGRVDVVGEVGRAQILLVDEKAHGPGDLIKVTVNLDDEIPRPSMASEMKSRTWKIVARRPRWSFVDLDKESFFDLLMEVAKA